MKKMIVGLLVIIVGLVVMACTPAGPAPGATTAPPAAKPAQPRTADAWETLVAEAKKEGVISVWSAGPGPATRIAVSNGFKEKYGIEAQFTTFQRGEELATRLQRERAAGLDTADVLFTGTTTVLIVLKPAGVLGSTEPFLLLPEVKDPKLWTGGRFPFVDSEKLAIQMIAAIQRYIAFNTDLVKKGEITSYKDLLNPRYKGKMTMNDPTLGGPTLSMMTFLAREVWSLDEAKDFLRKLVKDQEVVIQRDVRLHLESVARGKYAIGIGPWPDVFTELIRAGAPLDAAITREGITVSAAAGGLGLPAMQAHPNATRLFVNWLLSKEGQTVLSKGYGWPSMRTDVPTDHIHPLFLPGPDEKQFPDDEAKVLFGGQMRAINAEVIAEAMKK